MPSRRSSASTPLINVYEHNTPPPPPPPSPSRLPRDVIVDVLVAVINNILLIVSWIMEKAVNWFKFTTNVTVNRPDTSTPLAVLITDATSQLGKTAALHFASRGYYVLAGIRKFSDGKELSSAFIQHSTQSVPTDKWTYLQRILLDALPSVFKSALQKALLTESKGEIIPLIMDLADKQSIVAAKAQVSTILNSNKNHLIRLCGIIDNSTTLGLPLPIELIPKDSEDYVFNANYFNHLLLVREFLPLLCHQSQFAQFAQTRITRPTLIIVGGKVPIFPRMIGMGVYAAARAALEVSVASLRTELELTETNVRVSILRHSTLTEAALLTRALDELNQHGESISNRYTRLVSLVKQWMEQRIADITENTTSNKAAVLIMENLLQMQTRPRQSYQVHPGSILERLLRALVPYELLEWIYIKAVRYQLRSKQQQKSLFE